MYWYKDCVDIKELVGRTFEQVFISATNDAIVFQDGYGIQYHMVHDQDCCEHVVIDDINGELQDLTHSKILSAEESVSIGEDPEGVEDSQYCEDSDYRESFTWTFYRIATEKGTVVIRWYGESNGYYSESVDIYKVDTNNN